MVVAPDDRGGGVNHVHFLLSFCDAQPILTPKQTTNKTELHCKTID